ncbi:MAG TPA: phosphotransferase [Chitinophagaceae bacterium]|nr:phosphotransferase [Chitinophagaceae bacterium]
MINEIPKEVISAFTGHKTDFPLAFTGKITIVPIGEGLINRSYKVSCKGEVPFMLQQINKNVFPNPAEVQENYVHISRYAAHKFSRLRLPKILFYDKKKSLFIDKDKNYWRAFEFIGDSFSLNIAETSAQARATAKTFAKFTAAFVDFNLDLLKIVIPDFHNLSLRYQQLEEALAGSRLERMPKALPLVEELKQREHYKNFYETVISSGKLPKRAMHHDAKISNILFSKSTQKIICPVDFDTVMPGYFFSDMGDMIRSMACNLDESSIEFDKMRIRKGYYRDILEGYLSVMKKYLTGAEIKYIHYAGLLMIYMQALRFMTDYLNGDSYYRISYAGQNFDKAKNQLTLLKRLEEFLQKEYRFKG